MYFSVSHALLIVFSFLRRCVELWGGSLGVSNPQDSFQRTFTTAGASFPSSYFSVVVSTQLLTSPVIPPYSFWFYHVQIGRGVVYQGLRLKVCIHTFCVTLHFLAFIVLNKFCPTGPP